MKRWICVIGVTESGPRFLGSAEIMSLKAAGMVIAAPRFHADLSTIIREGAELVAFTSPLTGLYAQIHQRAGSPVVVLATGDPLWFGIGASLVAEFGGEACDIRPNISGLQLAAARMGWPISSFSVVTIHGRSAETILPNLYRRGRLLVIGESVDTPLIVARLLECNGYGDATITALANLGGEYESRHDCLISEWDMKVSAFHILAIETTNNAGLPYRGCLPDIKIENDGKLTKFDIRVNAIAKLAPFPSSVMWDLGAGSAAVAIDFMRAAPGSTVFAIDHDEQQIEMAKRNAQKFGVPSLQHIKAKLPDGLAGLPRPDAVFLGGGISFPVIKMAIAALQQNGVIVAHAVTLESEMVLLEAWKLFGGDMARIAVQHASLVGEFHGWRPLMPITQWYFTAHLNSNTKGS